MTFKRSAEHDLVVEKKSCKRIRLTVSPRRSISPQAFSSTGSSTAASSPRSSFSSASSYCTDMSELSTVHDADIKSETSSIHSDDSVETQKRKKRLTIGGPRKPTMQLKMMLEEMKTMRSKLDALLPQLAESNRDLSSEHNMERGASDDDDDESQHIDMEIACGVLEEKSVADENPLSDANIKLPTFAARKPEIVDLSGNQHMDDSNNVDDDSGSDSDTSSDNDRNSKSGSEPPQYLQGGHADEPCIMRTLIRHQSGDRTFSPSRQQLIELEAENRRAHSPTSLSEMSEDELSLVKRRMRKTES